MTLLINIAAVDTAAGSTLIENRPLVNMDMNTFATCTSTDPNTCLEASKNQILTGRCGRSLQRLYTRDINASPPRASCTNRANGPSRRHSPLSSSSSLGAEAAAAAAAVATAVAAAAVAFTAPVVNAASVVVVAVAAVVVG